jgi:hypothetical protein
MNVKGEAAGLIGGLISLTGQDSFIGRGAAQRLYRMNLYNLQ